jgi:YD repeat-containing protein
MLGQKKVAGQAKADLTSGSVVVSNYFSNNLFDETPVSVLKYPGGWFVMHNCCDLTWLDVPPETYTFSSSCPHLSLTTRATITAADNSWAQNYMDAVNKNPGPYTWAEWWMGLAAQAEGWVDKPTTCTIDASNNGQTIATAEMVVPPSNMPSQDPGDETNPCDQCNGGDPISLQTGNVSITQTDVRLPGLGGGLTLTRSWNSKFPYSTQASSSVGMFGPYWRSTYEEGVFVNETFNYVNVKYQRDDGSFWTFGWNSSGTAYELQSPANAGAALTAGKSYWTVTYKNGEKRLFSNTSGKLVAIIDRNGNVTELAYDALNRLTSISDPAKRHLYFSYGVAGSELNGNGYLVTKVTSDVGVTLSYTYDPVFGYLKTVTKLDGTNTFFQYQGAFISAVLDTNGKVLESHTYDQYGRGLTSSRANGVGAITMTYPETD